MKIITDVSADKKMWVLTRGYYAGRDPVYEYVEIHIHAAKDVNGGGWNHGKFGSGQTNVIEWMKKEK